MQWQTTCNDRGMYKEQGKLHNGGESLLGSEKKKPFIVEQKSMYEDTNTFKQHVDLWLDVGAHQGGWFPLHLIHLEKMIGPDC